MFFVEDFELGVEVFFGEVAPRLFVAGGAEAFLDHEFAGGPDGAAPVLAGAVGAAGVAGAIGGEAWDAVAAIERRGVVQLLHHAVGAVRRGDAGEERPEHVDVFAEGARLRAR